MPTLESILAESPATTIRQGSSNSRPRYREMMQAAVLAAPGRFCVAPAPIPEPGPLEVRVRLEGCGVCGSNLTPWEGKPWFQYPLSPGSPGHEGWGTVDCLGEEVSRFRVGQRVALLSSHAFAEFDVAPESAVIPLPRALDHIPFPGEAIGCAMNVFRRSGIKPGESVAIVGIGFLGALLTSLAVEAGARVIAISRRPFALDFARRAGAHELIPMENHQEIINEVRRLTAGSGCDCVIEAVGTQWPLDLATELTRERGRLIIAGYHQDGPRQVNMQLWNWRGLDVINAHERDPLVYSDGVRQAVEAVLNRVIDPVSLCTHSFPMDRINDAFDLMRERPDGFMKSWISF